jgi:hypothetical protein
MQQTKNRLDGYTQVEAGRGTAAVVFTGTQGIRVEVNREKKGRKRKGRGKEREKKGDATHTYQCVSAGSPFASSWRPELPEATGPRQA